MYRSNPKEYEGATVIASILGNCRTAPKYVLPDGGNLLGNVDPVKVMCKLMLAAPNTYRLPSKAVVIEFPNLNDTNPKEVNRIGHFITSIPKKVVIYCENINHLDEQEIGYRLMTFFETTEGVFFDHFVTCFNETSDGVRIPLRFHPLKFPHAREMAEYVVKEVRASSVCSVLSLIAALACKNVKPVETQPDVKLNKKRIAHDKPPFSKYYTLELNDQPRPQRGPSQGGTHASPAFHVRRGHIRHYPPTKNNPDGLALWINEQPIGSPDIGTVRKDYLIHKGQT